MPDAIAIIPARYGSTRFPGKPLASDTGRPLIQHVVEQVYKAERVSRVLVATDDERIAQAVRGFGGEVVMTRDGHPNGTSRLAEVVDVLDLDDEAWVLNVQGDEPEIDPAVLDALIAAAADGDAPMLTLCHPIDAAEAANPNVVKVVTDTSGNALYFSRAPIPYPRDAPPAGMHSIYKKHVGVYLYRRGFISKYVVLPPTPLEGLEQLEQLRVLEHGHAIRMVVCPTAPPGIDTPDQYAAFVERWRAGEIARQRR